MSRSTSVFSVFGVLLVLVAAQLRANEPLAGSPSEVAPEESLKPHELRAAVRSALKQEASATGTEYEQTVRQLVYLHEQLRDDALLVRDERLQLAHIVKQRLERASKRVEKLVRYAAHIDENRECGEHNRAPSSGVLADLIRKAVPGQWQEPPVAAQQFGFGANGPRVQVMAAGPIRQAPHDRGQELVELIQTTIAPDTWDTNGGLGTIVYFGPSKSLVVRQTSEVHGNLGGLIRDLRK